MDATLKQRLLYVAGAVVCLALLLLGGVWPTLFTAFALFAFPSPILFLVGSFKPGFIAERPKLRFYLIVCVVLAITSWSIEIAWLTTKWGKGGLTVN